MRDAEHSYNLPPVRGPFDPAREPWCQTIVLMNVRQWRELPWDAKAFRIGHFMVAAIELSSVGYVWACAITRRRDKALVVALALLSAQGVGLVIGRGNCPLGPPQRRLGDPVPLFELVLPPRAAKAAVPALFAVTMAGVLALALRRPRTRG